MESTIYCPKGIRGRRGRPGPQASMVRPALKDLRGLQVLKEINGLMDLKAIKALKDPRAILVNPS